jgi:endonuclease YncB( thermonuclease family)
MRRLWIAILVAALSVPTVTSADYLGKVTAVVDGDTFSMEVESGKVRVRICGIDAPERGQPGYGQAAGVLSNMIEGKLVHCRQVGEGSPCDGKSKPSSRDRIVAQCFRAMLYRQARYRGGDDKIRNRVRLAQVLRQPLQEQRQDLFT